MCKWSGEAYSAGTATSWLDLFWGIDVFGDPWQVEWVMVDWTGECGVDVDEPDWKYNFSPEFTKSAYDNWTRDDMKPVQAYR